jgi:23S rRNA (pseudouridine1915-N3)-methyltransferase
VKLQLIAVGSLKQPYAREGCALFEKRLKHMCRFEHTEVRDAKRKGSSPADVLRWKAQEAEHIQSALSGASTWVALDERGESWGSEQLASYIQECQTRSHTGLAFVIGGPDGFDASLLKSAPKRLCLGKMTLPHELARLVLLEQLYRAHSILANTPYHRP